VKRALILAAGLLLAGCSGDPPDIAVARQIDLGTVVKGVKATATVAVRNRGGAPLKVFAVSTSCGCTTASITPNEIPAGGEGLLRVVYDSTAHQTDVGDIERFVFIASDDPDQGDLQIKLHVRVNRPGA